MEGHERALFPSETLTRESSEVKCSALTSLGQGADASCPGRGGGACP